MEAALFTIFDIINLGLVVFLWWFTLKNYSKLPQKIPVHFDVEGKPDNLGSKKFSFLVPIFSLIFYIGFRILVQFPEMSNFPVEITEANRDIQFSIMIFFLKWLLFLVLLTFFNIQDYILRYSFNENAKVRVPFSIMLFTIIGSLIAVFIITAQFKSLKMHFLYSISIHLLIFGMKVFSLFNDKTKKGVEGRKQSLNIIKSKLLKTDKVIWMHAASLGEFEQGLPVLERLKQQFPECKILVTFFSPSGYENVIKKKNIADVVCYLPFDTRQNVKEFINEFSAELFFTVKYDYWYNLLDELKKNKVKTFVISALFYERQSFFTSYGKWFVKQLKKNIDWFFHQTQHSYLLAKSIGLQNSSVTGDTRFDRVKHLKIRDNNVDFVKEFIEDKKTIVFGSSWQAEEKIAKIVSENNPNTKIIIAPHDLKRVGNLKQIFPNSILYSEIQTSNFQFLASNIMIIDSIGLLSKLYSYADIAVVGGGFHDSGLHNILEAATFGVPVVFGNHYKKNPEADDLIKAKGAKSFENENATAIFISCLLNNEEILKEMSENAIDFIIKQPNSSELILQKIVSF